MTEQEFSRYAAPMHYIQLLPAALKTTAITLIAFLNQVLATVDPMWPSANDAPEAVEATVVGVLQDSDDPIWGSKEEDAGQIILWGLRESDLKKHAVGDGGRSHGIWQQRTMAGLSDSALVQVRSELRLLHEGARMCPESPAAVLWGGCGYHVSAFKGELAEVLANRRVARAHNLMLEARAIASLEYGP